MIRVLIIDDHPIVRTGVRSLLEEAPDIEVVAEAATGEDGLDLAERIRPDVVVLDISLPGMSGMEVLKNLKKEPRRVAVLVLSLHPEDRYAIRLLRAGASGYLSKEAPPETLIGAIRKVHSGGKFISSEVAERLAFNLDPEYEGLPHERLSSREIEVMRLLASGKTVTEIGQQLELSVKTVSTYRRRILEKMMMKSTAEIVRYAVENRLVE
ncbi:MAG: response regulator transcription factor [bacterium]|nr:response regulator transcription factor [bacterium]